MQRPQVAERYRGAPRLNVNPDTDETMCIACDLCALACPENLIVVSSERNEQTRRKELTNFTYDLSRCMFCGLCEDACPVDALELTQDFELASYTAKAGSGIARRWKKARSPRCIRDSRESRVASPGSRVASVVRQTDRRLSSASSVILCALCGESP
jgi:formate hydrogenlyase subunit 6/NADH:ubiquinone oxidoreductase subunit I